MGEKNFGLLYKAAKYISDGQKHSRARKYADAATGKVTLEHLREEICAKRNKDLLMSYGLVLFAKDRQKDLLARYQFIQGYAKEAKQFGAQRRASETAAETRGLFQNPVVKAILAPLVFACGVDPETSRSTIEMRRAIAAFNLPLFGLENVTLKDNHALIAGSRGNYSVHLGSGVVHLEGGAMLHILPVHSQKRGRLFLPFVDEDPKMAEIMSKIVLLAEDKKIKDPLILGQL